MGTNELNYLDNLIEEMREKEAEVKAISEEIDTLKALVRGHDDNIRNKRNHNT